MRMWIILPFPEIISHIWLFKSKDDQMQVIGNLKNISMASSKLLLAAKSLSVDPAAGNAKNLLAAARYFTPCLFMHVLYMLLFLYFYLLSPACLFRTVTDSINQLITLCTQNAPGQKECDNALRELEVLYTNNVYSAHLSNLF